MRKHKKMHIGIICIITMMLVISSVIPASLQGNAASAAETDASSTHRLRINAVKTEQTVNVSVLIEGNEPRLDALQFELKYDENTFSLKEVNDRKLIGGTSQFSQSTDTNPYFCSWYVGSAEKPENADGEVVNFVFDIREAAANGTYVFEITEIKAFYNISEGVGQDQKVTEKKANISPVAAELTIQSQAQAVLYTYDEAVKALEAESEKVKAAMSQAKENSLKDYDPEERGYSREAAESVCNAVYREAAAEIDRCKAEQLSALKSSEDEKESLGQGGLKQYDISQMLEELRSLGKDEEAFEQALTDEDLLAAELNMTESLDGKRIVNVVEGENLSAYFAPNMMRETIYFSFTVTEDGMYGIDAVYADKNEYLENGYSTSIDNVYRKIETRYKSLSVSELTAEISAENEFVFRRLPFIYENDVRKDLLKAGNTFVFQITITDGRIPSKLCIKNYQYSKGKIITDGNGSCISAMHNVDGSYSELEFSVCEGMSACTLIAVPHDGYVFDGLYADNTKIGATVNSRDRYCCFTFYNASGEEVSVNDFWIFGGDIYFRKANEASEEMTAVLSYEQLETAGLSGIEGVYSESLKNCEFTLEALMKKIGAKTYSLKKQASTISFDAYSEGLKTGSNVEIRAKFKLLLGDINGNLKVDLTDVLYLKRYLAGWDKYQNIDRAKADLNADGEITSADLMILERHTAGWKDYQSLPYSDKEVI